MTSRKLHSRNPIRTLSIGLTIATSLTLIGCTAEKGSSTHEAVSESETKTTLPELSKKLPMPVFVDPQQACDGDANCLTLPTTASSPQDLEWMIKSGYPTTAEQSSLSSTDVTTLKRRAAAGSLTAQTELGSRMVESNDPQGLAVLQQAAERGSIYSYYKLSEAMLKFPELGGNVEAAAFLRLAYILGDHKAATALQNNFPNLDAVENRAVDERAALLYKSFAKSRQPAPRPTL